ncbi:MAG: FAD-dependent oxidoreductase [Acidobacteria bacterium]|nr:FAD-dependent oxidoreductase [Acidobacteriota bacterium]
MKFTRREILTAFLSSPLALSACQNPTPQFPKGEIINTSQELGHKIRDGLKLEPALDNWKNIKIVIVGGGIAGLSAAWRLKKLGFEDFILIELEKTPGGTARSGESKLVSYPWGAHYVPAPMKENVALLELFNEMGILEGEDNQGQPIVAEQYLCRDPEERLFFRGRWYEGLYLYAGASEKDLAEFKAFQKEIDRWVEWQDSKGRRAFTIPMAKVSDDVEVTDLDKISMSTWLKRYNWTSPRLRWLVDYSCRDDYGSSIETTSAWAGIFYFASRMAKPGATAQPLITWPEGNGRLANYLYSQVKDKVRLGLAALEINPIKELEVEITTFDQNTSQAFGFRAEQVIFAAPHFLTNYIIRPYRDNPPKHVEAFQYGAWMVANLFLRDRPSQIRASYPLCWDNVFYESKSLGYVVATHQRGLDYGATIFTYYYPITELDVNVARKKLLSTDWQGWADVALTDISQAHPDIYTLTEQIDIMRWGHAMVRPHPDFIWNKSRFEAAKPFRNIHFAHADLSGVALFEEAFYQGVRVAEEILTSRNLKFKSII